MAYCTIKPIDGFFILIPSLSTGTFSLSTRKCCQPIVLANDKCNTCNVGKKFLPLRDRKPLGDMMGLSNKNTKGAV
jgi:hypothetical protein